MADGTTPLLSLILPEVGLSYNTWGEKINENLEVLDEAVGAIQPQQLGGAGTGLVAAISANEFATRTLTASAGLTVTDGDGVAGNPTIAPNPTGLAAKALPVSADEVMIADSAAAYAPRKATRTNFLKNAILTAPQAAVNNLGTPSGSVALDLATSNCFIVEVNTPGKSILTQNGPAGTAMEVTLVLTLGASGGVNFVNDAWKWAGGVAPTWTVGGTDIVKLLWVGDGANTIYGWRVAAAVA